MKNAADAKRIATNMMTRMSSHVTYHEGCDAACETYRSMNERWRKAADWHYHGGEA